MNATAHHADLDRWMNRRRLELRMTWGEVAVRSGITRAGLGMIRRGERRPNSLSCAKIEDALEWAPGSVDAILAGGEPTNAPEGVRVQYGLVVGADSNGNGDTPEADDDDDELPTAALLSRRVPAAEAELADFRDVDEQYIWLLDEVEPVDRRDFINKLRRARLRRRKAAGQNGDSPED